MDTHAFDAKGNLKDYVETDTTMVKLASLSPITLPSGVIYVVRPSAQPSPGSNIGSTDIIKLMSTTVTYVATNTDGKVAFTSPYVFRNTIAGSGIPELDPAYYYVKQSVLDNATGDLAKQRSFYEIEGFSEGLQKVKAFGVGDEGK